MNFLDPLFLSLRLSLITTLLLAVIGIPLAWWLSSLKSRSKALVETLISLPIVLPPSVLGFYLLLAFSPNAIVGKFLQTYFDLRLVFSFPGLVLASLIYSLPFMVNPVQSGFESLNPDMKDAAYTLGLSPFKTFLKILLPNIKPALLTGLVLTFAHTMGEFGVVLMIGGNIPGATKVASIAIYEEVESMNYAAANQYSLALIGISFSILFLLFLVNRRNATKGGRR